MIGVAILIAVVPLLFGRNVVLRHNPQLTLHHSRCRKVYLRRNHNLNPRFLINQRRLHLFMHCKIRGSILLKLRSFTPNQGEGTWSSSQFFSELSISFFILFPFPFMQFPFPIFTFPHLVHLYTFHIFILHFHFKVHLDISPNSTFSQMQTPPKKGRDITHDILITF